tara:strand:- start:438 stop:1478 length:1041 start_codon:yes stop_codon:yes gene_type:complete
MEEYNIDELIKNLDTRDMAGFTRRFVDDLESSFNIEIDVEKDFDWSGVLCLGVGGSGAGGGFLKSLIDYEGGIPFVIWKDYELPSWWGPDWLIIATSYSGNTEETLSGVIKALEGGGTVVGITSGGKLEDILSNNDTSLCLSVPGGQMPRSAFGHLLGAQLAACWALGILPRPDDANLQKMLTRLRSISIDNDISGGNGMTLNMAQSLIGKQIGIISPTLLGPAGVRFANQLNENSNRFARPVNLPEMNHNEIVAWKSAEPEHHSLIYFSWDGMHPKVLSRLNWMLEELSNDSSWIIDCEGQSLLECLLYAAHVTDWISIALALIEGVDPSEMQAIVSLKKHLSSI